jgi:hypothetical protein
VLIWRCLFEMFGRRGIGGVSRVESYC